MINLKQFEVVRDPKFSLARHDPAATPGVRDRAQAADLLAKYKQQLIEQQRRLYADGQHGLLLVLQAMDGGGKDGTIRSVLSGVNPQGVRVTSFKVPSLDEAKHDFLWRVHAATPARGEFGVFNRSHYEEVIVAKVHADQLLPAWAAGRKGLWQERYQQINDFEKLLSHNNILVVKCFLHISREEQKQRMEKRLSNPAKNWKFSAGDLAERERWDDYMHAYEEAFRATATHTAPWYVIPSDKKWYRNAVVARLLTSKLDALKLKYPVADADALAKLAIK